MTARKIANAALVFAAVTCALPLLAFALPFAAAVWAYNETDEGEHT